MRQSAISSWTKYLFIIYNIFLWFVSLLFLGIGIYAWNEKDMFKRLSSITIGIILDPAFIFLLIGGFLFIISLCGLIGGLRLNTKLIYVFVASVSIIFFLELGLGLGLYFFKDKLMTEIRKGLQLWIRQYREDEDLQDLTDWIQRSWLQCCGVTGPNDWNDNVYFECKVVDPWIESCGVPYSCCTSEYSSNRQCGFEQRLVPRPPDFVNRIYNDGCLAKGSVWVNNNILPLSIAVGVFAFLQFFGLYLAKDLRAGIKFEQERYRKSQARARKQQKARY